MTPDWSRQNRANGQLMLGILQSLGCEPRMARQGQYMALCPFHDDHTPSFSLDTENGRFYCFRCQIGGYLDHFANALHAKGYKTGLRARLGKSERQKNRRDVRRKTELPILSVDAADVAECHEQATRHWHEVLMGDEGHRRLIIPSYSSTFRTRTYDMRTKVMLEEDEHTYISPQFTEATVRAFRIGFAPPSNVELVHALRKDFSADVILATGLFHKQGNNGIGCTLAGRIVYPYLIGDKSVYAIGRLTEHTPGNASKSKYLKQRMWQQWQQLPFENPPLFNVDILANTSVVLITEGITDAIAACQAGIATVSTVTTSFKRAKLDEIAGQLRGKKVIICNDNEENGSGDRGAEQMESELMPRGIDVQRVQLPRTTDQAKVDVCSFIRDVGAAEFKKLVESQTGISLPEWSC